MIDAAYRIDQRDILAEEIQELVRDLGKARMDGGAYDTAWVARLAPHYPGRGFENSIEWLRRHQMIDGTWGSGVPHYHDRFISTLASIVALREVGGDSRDERRVKRGEDALWKIVGKLGQDDSDTVGFPILSISLAKEAADLGLDVPRAPIRFAKAYEKKVQALLNRPENDWRESTLAFSVEALRSAIRDDVKLLEKNHSVGISPSATAGYLLQRSDEQAIEYLQYALGMLGDGSVSTVAPSDIAEIAWSINHLRAAGAISPDEPEVKRALDDLWSFWLPETGVSSSSVWAVPELDDTAACVAVLRWAGYAVNPDVLGYYELDEHFYCYKEETNPSLSAHIRLLAALRSCEDHPNYPAWTEKVLKVLHRFDENGAFWWDKWHASPYYVSGAALRALHGVDDALATSRSKWITRTQNDDGGWGYLGQSTLEETAYCLEALLFWDRVVGGVEPSIMDQAAQYLQQRYTSDYHHEPLWIGKGLYTPVNIVKAAVLGALYGYYNRP